MKMKRWLREPLVHFLIAGGLLFAAYGWLHSGTNPSSGVVRITAADVNWLKDTWTRQWQRSPSDEELRGLVADYIREDLLAREARALKLDENDAVVRRRLAQKMRFLVEDTATLGEPGEDELRRLYASSAVRYQTPARITFSQIFFKTEAAARRRLAQLAQHPAIAVGEPSLLERDYTDAEPTTVSSVFGPKFAEQVFTLAPGRWQGPVASGYGFHLVRVRAREAAQPRPFEAVRAQLREEWQRTRQAEANARFFAELLKKYPLEADASVRPLLGPLAQVTP